MIYILGFVDYWILFEFSEVTLFSDITLRLKCTT